MKKLIIASLALACLATPAFAAASKRNPSADQPTREQIATEAAREAVVPAAELNALLDRWNGIADTRNHRTEKSEFDATVAVTADTMVAVHAARAARIDRNRAEFDKQKKIANDGMNAMCAVLSGC